MGNVENLKAIFDKSNQFDSIVLTFNNNIVSPHPRDWYILEKYEIEQSKWEEAEIILKKQIATKYISDEWYMMTVDYMNNDSITSKPSYVDITNKMFARTNKLIDTDVDREHIYIYRIIYGLFDVDSELLATGGWGFDWGYYWGGEQGGEWFTYDTQYVGAKYITSITDYGDEYDLMRYTKYKMKLNKVVYNHRYRGGVESVKFNAQFKQISKNLELCGTEITNFNKEVEDTINILYNKKYSKL